VQRVAITLRHRAAAVVLATMALVVSSPLWHDRHHHLGVVSDPFCSHSRDDLQVCDTGDHLKKSPSMCPICLSQRLLGQSQAESTYQVSVPDQGSWLLTWQPLPAAITLAVGPQARSPPAA